MRHLVVAIKRGDARAAAEARWPRRKDDPGTVHQWRSGDEDDVRVAIYGENLEGRVFDRIWLMDQKKASDAAKDYLTWRLHRDGMFMRIDDDA